VSLRSSLLVFGVAFAAIQSTLAQGGMLNLPATVKAGEGVSIETGGTGHATLYVVGLGQALKRDLELGQPFQLAGGTLYNAGSYVAVLVTDSSTSSQPFEVVAATKPADVSFLAKPSRLPVGIHNGVTGAVYVFDAYRNLVTDSLPVSFLLQNPSGAAETRTAQTHNGAAWIQMDSTAQQGIDKFVARVGEVSSTRIVQQVPGDPCVLKMTARQSGQQVELETEPVRDCSGNAVPDGTIVTFTASRNGTQSSVDVPLKRGIAEVQMPLHGAASISVASGVVMGNQIRWEK